MEVIIHSALPTVGGRVTVATDPGQSVDSLVSAFCVEKGIRQKRNYILRNAEHDVLDHTKTLAACGVENGEMLFITMNDSSADWPCGCNQWWMLAGVSLLIGCTGIVAVSIIQVKGQHQPIAYGVVLDAGSSHTSTFVQKWPGEKHNGTGVVSEQWQCDQHPGISNYTMHPEDAGKSLESCLIRSEKVVPSGETKRTPVFLGATAGMRLLEATDNETCEEIMASVRHSLSITPYNFTHPQKQARILTGAWEGAYSWVTVNYLNGSFGTVPLAEFLTAYITHSGDVPETIGALDLGGASTQISFVPASSSDTANGTVSLTLYGTTYKVYTHSYLCYGINEAYRQLLAQLVVEQGSGDDTDITNPCGPMGNTTSHLYSEIFKAPCTDAGSHAVNASANTTYHFKGSSDPEKCGRVTSQLFNVSVPCENPPCTFDGIHQPELNGQYMAFSTFYKVLKFFNASHDTATLEDFRENRDTFCGKSWQEISTFVVPSQESFLVLECFEGHFIDRLLSLYGFNTTNWSSLKFRNKVGNTTVGWSLGFMLLGTNSIPEELAYDPLSSLLFILLIVLFILFITFAIGFACYAKSLSKKPAEYTRLSTYGAV